jgi:hypothetical protein
MIRVLFKNPTPNHDRAARLSAEDMGVLLVVGHVGNVRVGEDLFGGAIGGG